jgi:protein-tyrosine phosphatase
MREVLDEIDAALDVGEVVYVHCWRGIGRTGTVLACWLIEHEQLDGDEAIERFHAWPRRSAGS